ncbi:xanthine dehydrogenase accessory protein XdhC [Litorivita pollutaquae]|uniref:Xanthine dehydrogenase accessory protein XdhC n=1 Tax=Litorivita pollutaquae TaxID=2200892 RepID=A0A2V4NK48_9RHOB|nr:xanthine dehydrogenase accessory protein XdhC [Litorivita pollutaquae]PYC46537.1 xanthine dehydrogenase accessory protein XdhC [Litorivita pollutaquae]
MRADTRDDTGFDLAALRAALTQASCVARVVVAAVRGSTPRAAGAAMLIWDGPAGRAQSGTIGGGALEFEAANAALDGPHPRHSLQALGPDLGQCCGGAVELFFDLFTAADMPVLETQDVIARGTGDMPLSVRRALQGARAKGERPTAQFIDGWMIEPVARPARPLWIWGAGHVGRALVNTLSPLPDFDITWVDTAADRFPDVIPDGVTPLTAQTPERLAAHVPQGAEHLILTYSHVLDLAICHALLQRGFSFAGLIGSKSKWARFRKRLAALGHAEADILRLTCPIGAPELGKHPQAIAVGVAAALLQQPPLHARKEIRA